MNYNIQVTLEECKGSFERMIKRFHQKTKNEGLVQEILKYERYEKPSDKKRRKKRQRERNLEKLKKENS